MLQLLPPRHLGVLLQLSQTDHHLPLQLPFALHCIAFTGLW